ncbi:hypothetical protein [Pontibacter akesuensis]|uniref:Uncharacterized protein n=1 Tax=Pontibacter akesuensis TaxID=388950 RepID=A0A1I7JJ41_9BACT|nr:hypothetical protein [Pontibacter akesuensis]GHA69595.1 hypothetical protein GCM10007389_23400 [Pontibacter akesuensis]SFU85193.1 hypothetical protein SAMN04487941_2934 [Pontibacter akesuensis]
MKQEEKKQTENRMKEDVNETSRTMKPGDKLKNSSTSSQSDATSPTVGGTGGGITNIRSGKDVEENSDQKY